LNNINPTLQAQKPEPKLESASSCSPSTKRSVKDIRLTELTSSK
jgi:hypothetical protein